MSKRRRVPDERDALLMRRARFRQDVVDRLDELGADVNVRNTQVSPFSVELVHPQTGESKVVRADTADDLLDFLRDAAADLGGL